MLIHSLLRTCLGLKPHRTGVRAVDKQVFHPGVVVVRMLHPSRAAMPAAPFMSEDTGSKQYNESNLGRGNNAKYNTLIDITNIS
mmetsp:Transcript_13032/g.23003  ORF Transcript_13032/g.23003 Transcript_13032/m.23003 type:complete len:84 (-) Transcript_13032:212-463(-)